MTGGSVRYMPAVKALAYFWNMRPIEVGQEQDVTDCPGP
jgi:hypothetical protein